MREQEAQVRGGEGADGQANVLDVSMKALCRRAPAALLRLAGLEVAGQAIRHEDVSVALPEFRADQVLVVSGDAGSTRFGVHFEYQTRPDRSALGDWRLKNAALNRKLCIPVFLIALYLERGDRASFPSDYIQREGNLVNGFLFTAVRLWEHTEFIRSGAVPELAPLLVLCEDSPEPKIIAQELEIIRAAPIDAALQRDLLAVAYTIGTRYFLRGVLNALFREEMPMLKDAGIISDWLEEARSKAIAEGLAEGWTGGRTEGLAEGRTVGLAEGLAAGRAIEARRLTLRVLRNRFGELPAALESRIERADTEACEALVDRAVRVESLSELLDD